jgi:hypothetical protein
VLAKVNFEHALDAIVAIISGQNQLCRYISRLNARRVSADKFEVLQK